MSVQIWLGYLGFIILFMCTPGPSHLLMISIGLKNGFPRSLATAAGDLSANFIQICLAAFGLAAVLVSSHNGFMLVKWLGVAYLAWMGIRTIIKSFNAQPQASGIERTSLKKLWFTGFITSAANPKAIVFFAALFPQFIQPTESLLPQIVILGGTYLIVDGLFLTFYGKTSSLVAQKLDNPGRVILDRLSGGGLVACAVMLGLVNWPV